MKFEDEMDKLNKLGNKICEDLLHYEKLLGAKHILKSILSVTLLKTICVKLLILGY